MISCCLLGVTHIWPAHIVSLPILCPLSTCGPTNLTHVKGNVLVHLDEILNTFRQPLSPALAIVWSKFMHINKKSLFTLNYAPLPYQSMISKNEAHNKQVSWSDEAYWWKVIKTIHNYEDLQPKYGDIFQGANIFDQKKVPAMLNIFLKENARHLTLKNAELFTHKNGWACTTFNFWKY